MTYSIVARDPETGEMGVAVQTFNLAVGTWVPWALGGVGAVATQALAERNYGTKGLELMAKGKSAEDALSHLLEVDPKREFRQVSMIDTNGRIAVHTGSRCFPKAGSFVGDNFCTQANMMERDTVWEAMAGAYQSSREELPARLLRALQAAEQEGGDLRGRQTSALLVVDEERTPIPLVDLRVDHHPEPLQELERLWSLHQAYMAEYSAAEFAEAGDLEGARAQLQRIVGTKEPYLQYLRALHLAGWHDRDGEALAILEKLIREFPQWGEYLRREAAVDNFGRPGLGARLLAMLDLNEGS